MSSLRNGTVGDRFVALRSMRRWTQAELGEQLGLCARQVSRIERGLHSTSRSVRYMLRVLETRLQEELGDVTLPSSDGAAARDEPAA